MKQALLTAIFTVILLALVFAGYEYYEKQIQTRKILRANAILTLDEAWAKTSLLAQGTAFNLDSLKHHVNDSILDDDLTIKIGEVLNAADSIRLKYGK